MRAAALGAGISWASVSAVAFVWPQPLLLAASLLLAVAFTVLLAAHLLVFVARMTALWRTMRSSAPEAALQAWPGRRAFLTSLAGATAAAFLPPLFGERGGYARFVEAKELNQGAADAAASTNNYVRADTFCRYVVKESTCPGVKPTDVICILCEDGQTDCPPLVVAFVKRMNNGNDKDEGNDKECRIDIAGRDTSSCGECKRGQKKFRRVR
jgi:hypothetical protein